MAAVNCNYSKATSFTVAAESYVLLGLKACLNRLESVSTDYGVTEAN